MNASSEHTGTTGTGEDWESPDAFEWARIRTFLRAPESPLAIIEIESERDAAQVIHRIQELAGEDRVHVFMSRPEHDFRWPLDWLESHGEHPGIFLFSGFESYAADEESAYRFWTWANMQRERWQRDLQKVVFVLPPAQVDALCRHAPMLWDWIPLKFNLTGRDPDEQQNALAAVRRAAARHSQTREQAGDEDAAQQAQRRRARLDSLRQQLLRARQKGFPERVILRDYAWPFFEALIEAGEMREAQRVLEDEMGHDFATELPYFQAHKALRMLEGIGLPLVAPERAARTVRAVRSYLSKTSPRSLESLRKLTYHALRCILAARCGDLAATDRCSRRALASFERLGHDRGMAEVLELQGLLFEGQQRHAEARRCYMKSLAQWERLGDSEQTMLLLRRLALSTLEEAKAKRRLAMGMPSPPRSTVAAQRAATPGKRAIDAALRGVHRLAEWLDADRTRTSGQSDVQHRGSVPEPAQRIHKV